jgi:hypothetical protein
MVVVLKLLVVVQGSASTMLASEAAAATTTTATTTTTRHTFNRLESVHWCHHGFRSRSTALPRLMLPTARC